MNESAQVASVLDGDTLQLTDGRRVRLLSVNTPELPHDGQPGQALAEVAREAVIEFLKDGQAIQLSYGQRRKDRYDRALAHVIHPQRGSLEKQLVALGLAFPIAVPPDVAYSHCLSDIADQARLQGLGIWAHADWAPVPAESLADTLPSFRRVCGRIAKADRNSALWLELEGDLVIHIARDDWPWFADSGFDLHQTQAWKGRNIEVWGWLQDRRSQTALMERGFKPWSLQVRSPASMRWIEQCP